MAIQNDNTLVTKGDLKTLFSDKIAPYLGGNFMLSTNVSDYYSTDEKMVGVWLDGRPIYQKTISTTLPILTTVNVEVKKNIAINASVLNVVNAIGYFDYYNTGNTVMIPCFIDSSVCIYLFGRPYNSGTGDAQNTVCVSVTPKSADAVSKFSENKVVIVVQYTKTTDTVGSAVTTPGCYDINRPDLWPANKEIFFGNGLYGYRATGNYTAEMPEGSTDWCSVVNKNIGFSTNYPTIQWGGNLQIYSGDNTAVINHPLNVRRSNNFFSCSFISAIGLLRINTCSTTGAKIKVRTQDKYDIWFTYTK